MISIDKQIILNNNNSDWGGSFTTHSVTGGWICGESQQGSPKKIGENLNVETIVKE